MKKALKKHFLLATIYFLYSLFFSSTTLAHNPSFTQDFIQIMNMLHSLGTEKIGGKSIEELKKQAQSIRVEIVPELKFQNIQNAQEGVFRGSGFWSKKLNTIFISDKHFFLMNVMGRFGITLHEFFEILDIKDENFCKSSLIITVFEMIKIESRKPEIIKSQNTYKIFIDQLNKSAGGSDLIYAQSGGVTGVGGGGDGRILSFVGLIYHELFYRLDRNLIQTEQFNKLIVFISDLDIEFSYRVKQGTYILEGRHLRVPSDSTTNLNFDTNAISVEKLVDQLLTLSETK